LIREARHSAAVELARIGSAMGNLLKIFHTIRYLRWSQIAYRLRSRVVRDRLRIHEVPSPRPGFPEFVGIAFAEPSMLALGVFRFLGETREISLLKWDNEDCAVLWRYNLHYFDDLNSRDADSRFAAHVGLLRSWVDTSLPIDHIAWAPYPTSLRISNWIKWLSRHAENATPSMLLSLAQQADVLEQRIEYHLLGNHLFENARALTLAGAYLSGVGPNRWLESGLRILDLELREQFLSDGGHFELTPMYQATMLWGLLDLIELASGHPHPALRGRRLAWAEIFATGLRWLEVMSFSDGEIAFFNDAAFGIAPDAATLRKRAQGVGVEPLQVFTPAFSDAIQLTRLDPSGYARVDWSGAVLIADIARVGPDYLPAHAHADSLSFEFALDGTRVFVNSGTSVYGTGAERQRQRGTAAHNTVVVDGQDSSEVWAGFRVARRAYPEIGTIFTSATEATIACSHTGYLRLPDKVRHARKWVCKTSLLEIEDNLEGTFTTAVGYLLLHPTCQIAKYSERSVLLRHRDGREIIVEVEGGNFRAEAGTWHPRFGESISTIRLVTALTDSRVRHCIKW
jgi:uncharacterized heparinase superfamily protein